MNSRLDNLASYFNEKERKRLDGKAKANPSGLPEMTFDEVKLSCLENNGYETPELNEKLYLHFRGFKRIENLDRFTGTKAIWLDSNGFQRMENLSPLLELRCLYLSKNLISKIEGLESLQHLTILDVSYNRITSMTGLGACPNLQTLNASHNLITNPQDLQDCALCPLLNNIDLSNNHLTPDEDFFLALSLIPALSALSLNGNEITKLPSFRKRLISKIPSLGYLDRPIDLQERTFALAFVAGGPEGESLAREQWKVDREAQRISEMEQFKKWQAEQAAVREAARAQGRSLITEFTPEERAQRAAEAQAAHNAEQEMLGLGIDNIAKRYWQLEGSAGGEGGDALEMAAAQLRAEKALRAERVRVGEEEEERVVELEGEEGWVEVGAEKEEGTEAAEAWKELVEVEAAMKATTLAPPPPQALTQSQMPPAPPSAEAEAACAAAAILEVGVGEVLEVGGVGEAGGVGVGDVGEEDARAERVAESFFLYKKTLEAKSTPITVTRPSTWESAAITKNPTMEKPIFWSEAMDVHLAKLVKACVFDFEAIATTMQQLGAKRALGADAVEAHAKPARLTSKVCRERWGQLDAAQWGAVGPNSSPMDVNFRVCIGANVVGLQNQPSYDKLASMALGSAPQYLKAPTAFPSVQDVDDEEDLDLD